MTTLPQIPVPPGRNEEPDSAPLLPPPRKVTGPIRQDTGERYEPSGPTRNSINDLTSKLAAWGPGVRIRVKRLLPQLGPTENGVGEWIEIPAVTPTEDDIQQTVLERYGGGEFLIQFRSQNSQRNEEDTLKLSFSGDWKPISAEGQALKARQMANGGVMPQPTLPIGPGLTEAASPLLQQVLASASEDKQQARQLAAEAQSSGANALVQLATALKPEPRSGGGEGIAAILAAVAPLVQTMIATQAENRRADLARQEAAERAREEREERRRAEDAARLERILAEAKTQQSPNFAMKAMESQFDVWGGLMKKGAEKAFDMALAASGKTEEEAGPIRTALAKLIENAGPGLFQAGASLLPALVGQNLGQQAPQQPAPQQQMMMPGTSQQTVFLPRAPAPQAVSPAPLPQPAQPPPPPAPPTAPPSAPEQQPQPTRADIATDLFLRHMGEFAKEKADPDLSWGFKVQGMDLAVVWGMTPVEFRQRMIKVNVESDALDPVAWVEGLNPLLGDTARLVDAALKSDPAATEWAREFLSYGPWVDEENDEQP